jgi:hypothetical protein
LGWLLIAVAPLAAAACSDDSKSSDTSTTVSGPAVIQSPATVTGITGVTNGSTDLGGAPTTPVAAATVPGSSDVLGEFETSLALVEAGTFDCATPGVWQPYPAIGIMIKVGQPAANSTCADDVLDFPADYCTDSCSSVPDDWHVVKADGVSPQSLTLLIAPTSEDARTAQFLCVRDFTVQRKQVLPLATPIETACLPDTSNSVEIPYVPPDTSDIYVPPPASVDIPNPSATTTIAG